MMRRSTLLVLALLCAGVARPADAADLTILTRGKSLRLIGADDPQQARGVVRFGADPALAGATRAFWQALNTADAKALATTWPAFEAALPGLEEHARGWASRLAAARDLAAQLVEFVEDRL